jgi:hypothetical protein
LRGTCYKGIAAGAFYRRLMVLRMDTLLHIYVLPDRSNTLRFIRR